MHTHAKAVGKPGAQPKVLFGQVVGGDYTMPSFMHTASAYGLLTSADTLGGYPISNWVHPILAQVARDGHTFSQIFAAKTLYNLSKGGNLVASTYWQSLPDSIKNQWKQALILQRTFDTLTLQPAGGRPANYLALGVLLEGYRLHYAFTKDRKWFDKLFTLCMSKTSIHNGFLDDDKNGLGRYDRYTFEFGRFLADAAQLAGTKMQRKEADALVSLQSQAWLASVSPSTHVSAHYGRSLQNAWDDVFEQSASIVEVGYLSKKAGLDLIADAWPSYLSLGYDTATHLSRMLEAGRGTYSYAGRERSWAYGIHSLCKAAEAIHMLESLPEQPTKTIKPTKSTFTSIPHGKKRAGIWTYQDTASFFTIPIVGSFKNILSSDYETAPYALAGLQYPVNRFGPYLSPSIEDAVGTIWTANGLADSINAGDKNLHVWWYGLTTGTATTNNIQHTRHFTVTDSGLTIHYEYVHFGEPFPIKDIQLRVPVGYPRYDPDTKSFYSRGGKAFRVRVSSDDFVVTENILSPAGTEDGLGAFGPVNFIQNCFFVPKQWLPGNTYKFTVHLLRR